MKVITVRNQIRDVASRYLEQRSRVVESDGRVERRFFEAWQEKIYNRLLALNVETATATDVEWAVGNSTWVEEPLCDECGEERAAVVELEIFGLRLCAECLRAALAAVEVEAEGNKP